MSPSVTLLEGFGSPVVQSCVPWTVWDLLTMYLTWGFNLIMNISLHYFFLVLKGLGLILVVQSYLPLKGGDLLIMV